MCGNHSRQEDFVNACQSKLRTTEKEMKEKLEKKLQRNNEEHATE